MKTLEKSKGGKQTDTTTTKLKYELIENFVAHHALAEVIGVDARQSPHEQWQHVSGSLGEAPAPRDEAPRHTDHTAESGGELVGFGEGLQSRVSSDAERENCQRFSF